MQRATAMGTFHHHHRLRQGHQQAVAGGEMPLCHSSARPLFRYQQTLFCHLSLQLAVVPRINPIQAGCKHPNGHTSRLQAAPMGGPINTFSKATQHRPTICGQSNAKPLGPIQAMGRWPPGADYRHRTPAPQ